MDVCGAFTLAMLILQNICDISSHNDNQRSRRRQSIQEVTKTTCGQSYEVRKELFLLYEGAFLENACIITIINTDRSPDSRTCVKLDEIFSYENSFECENNFRFYFGNYGTKNVTNYLSCSDIRQEVCDVQKTAYASFNSHRSFDKRFQLKVSAMNEYSKRAADTGHFDADTSIPKWLTSGESRDASWDRWNPLMTTRSPWSSRRSWGSWRTSWSSWPSRSWNSWTGSRSSSWSSWYSVYEYEKEKKKKEKAKTGVIVIAVLGSIFCVAFAVIGCKILRIAVSNTDRREETYQNNTTVLGNHVVTAASQDEAVTSQENLSDSTARFARYSAAALDHDPTNFTLDHETGNQPIPSAPPKESPDNGVDAPPPSYSSLFPSK